MKSVYRGKLENWFHTIEAPNERVFIEKLYKQFHIKPDQFYNWLEVIEDVRPFYNLKFHFDDSVNVRELLGSLVFKGAHGTKRRTQKRKRNTRKTKK
jgi:hypothetical protein